MSVKQLIDGDYTSPFTLGNTLTINNNTTVDGDLNVNGFIYSGGVSIDVLGTNNTWTGTNNFTNHAPTCLTATNPDDIINNTYMTTNADNIGSSLLGSANIFTGNNTFDTLPILSGATAVGGELVNKTQTDTAINNTTAGAILASNNNFTGLNNFDNTILANDPVSGAEFSTKKYVDDIVANYNATGGNVLTTEISTPKGVVVNNSITAVDMANATAIHISIVGAGGNAVDDPANPPPVTFYGGSGGFISALLPPLDRDYELELGGAKNYIRWQTPLASTVVTRIYLNANEGEDYQLPLAVGRGGQAYADWDETGGSTDPVADNIKGFQAIGGTQIDGIGYNSLLNTNNTQGVYNGKGTGASYSKSNGAPPASVSAGDAYALYTIYN